MTAQELASYIGRTGRFTTREGLTIPVLIGDARESYGRTDLLVMPDANGARNSSNQAWISTDRITLDDEGGAK